MLQIIQILFVVALLLLAGSVHAQEGAPIPDLARPADQALFVGQPALAHSIDAEAIPQHPFMAGDEGSNIHNNGYMSDTYTHPGPLGLNPEVQSVALGGNCVTQTFDARGHLLTTCLSLNEATLFLLDVETLSILDSLALPYREVSLTDLEFPPGSYFYLDAAGRVMIPLMGNQIWQVAVTTNDTFDLPVGFDIDASLPEGDELYSVLPDFDGLLWFITKNGTVGTLDLATQEIASITMHRERIANSFAVDETGGVFVVTDTAMYRFDSDPAGAPFISWREEYDRGTQSKPGQSDQGSGTTPTIMGDDYVTITDNAEPQMHVLVYQRAAHIQGDRLVCAVPVFTEGASATENSLIATDRSIIVENNYGYTAARALIGLQSEPGLTRIDVTVEEECNVVWTSDVRVPTAVSKLSTATGLIYTYTQGEGRAGAVPWYFMAVDFSTGEMVWRRYTGTGVDFNNYYAAVYLGRDATAYVGVRGGIVAIRDS